jgi:heat shock protein HslJ
MSLRRTMSLLVLLPALLALPSCMPDDQDAGAPPANAPTPDELRNLTYTGLTGDSTVALKDGEWQGAPFATGGTAGPRVTLVPGFRLVGDLDGDGADEAVVLLSQSTGGSGVFDYVAVTDREDGQPRNEATAALGDRVQVRDAHVAGGLLVFDLVRAGPEDAMCCPGELARRTWRLGEGTLVALSDSVTGRLSPAALGDGGWALEAWDQADTVAAPPGLTLRLDQGKLTGSSGCNRYTAPFRAGDSPGDATVGPIVSTKMACPDSVMAIEQQFLARLAGVNRYGFLAGRLQLQWRTGDASGVMLFARQDETTALAAPAGAGP